MPARPSANELERFLLGTLPPANAARVAEWVTTAPEAAETLRALSAADTFTESVKVIIRGDRAQFGTAAPSPDQTVTQLEAPAPSAPSSIAFPPTELGGFRVVRELGRGGMGAVFEATDAALGRKVALKVMLPDVAVHPQARARFLREARAAARVEHETIVPIYQVGEANGVPYIAMPLLVGESLDTRLKVGNPLPLAEVLLIGRQMAEGLAAAHAGGLIHRDIKPSNIWLDLNPNGSVRRVRILDFGLARAPGDAVLTGAGDILGTPAYMSLEQARGQLVDFRTDLYSLGVVLYQATTGRRPFAGGSAYAVLALLAVHVPPAPVQVNPAVPPALSLLIVKLMSKTPAGRPQSARAVIEELARLVAPQRAPVPAVAPRSGHALPAVPPRPAPVPPPLPSPETVSVAAEPISTLPDAPDPVPEPEPLSLDAEFSVGVDVTELFQPDPPRRPRRGLLIAVGAVVAVGLLVAVVLAVRGGKNRQEQETTKAEAELPPANLFPGDLLVREPFDDSTARPTRVEGEGRYHQVVENGVYVIELRGAKKGDYCGPWFGQNGTDAFAIRVKIPHAPLGVNFRALSLPESFDWANFHITDGRWQLRTISQPTARPDDRSYTDLAQATAADPELASGRWVTVAGYVDHRGYEIWVNGKSVARGATAVAPNSRPGVQGAQVVAGPLTADGDIRLDIDYAVFWKLPKTGMPAKLGASNP